MDVIAVHAGNSTEGLFYLNRSLTSFNLKVLVTIARTRKKCTINSFHPPVMPPLGVQRP